MTVGGFGRVGGRSLVQRTRWRVVVLLLLSTGTAKLAFGGGDGLQEGPLDPTPFASDDWYGVYFRGTKVGSARTRVTISRLENVPVVRAEMTLLWRFDGKESALECTKVYSAGGRQELLESKVRITAGGVNSIWRGVRRGEFFSLTGPGSKEGAAGIEIPAPMESLRDWLAAQILGMRGRSEGDTILQRDFNPRTGKEGKNTLMIAGFKGSCSSGTPAGVASVVLRPTRGHGTLEVARDGRILEMVLDDLLTLRLESQEEVSNSLQADALLLRLASVGLRLGPPQRVRKLVLRLTGLHGEMRPANESPRQSAVPGEDGATTVTVDAEVPIDSLPPAGDKDIREALVSTGRYPSEHAEVMELARKALGPADTPDCKVQALLSFVASHVQDALTPPCESGLDVMRNMKGTCVEHAVLFVTLCRAAGVPARELSGIAYAGDETGAFGSHVWAEVALSGRWVPVDPTFDEFPVDATHIAFARRSRGSYATLVLLGVKCEVVSVVSKE